MVTVACKWAWNCHRFRKSLADWRTCLAFLFRCVVLGFDVVVPADRTRPHDS